MPKITRYFLNWSWRWWLQAYKGKYSLKVGNSDANYRSHGRVARSSQYWVNASGRIHVVRTADNNFSNLNDRKFVARNLVRNVESWSTRRKTALDKWRSRSSTMLGSWEVFISSIQMTWISRTPWKNARNSRSRLWNQPCLAWFKTLVTKKLVTKTNPILADQNTYVPWNPTNLRESALEGLTQMSMKIASLERGSSHWVVAILCASLFLRPQALKIPDAKAAVVNSVGKAQHIAGMAKWRKSGAKEKSFKGLKKKREGQEGQVMLLRWWTYVTSRSRSWGQKFQKYHCERRFWLLRRKIRSIVRQRHQWRPQKLWMVLQDYQDASDKQLMQYLLIIKTLQHCRNVHTSGNVYRDKNDHYYGPTLKNPFFFLSDIFWVSHLPDYCGKTTRKSSIEKRMGESSKMGVLVCASSARSCLFCVRGRHFNGLERSKISFQCGRHWWNTHWSGRRHVISW